VDPTGLKIYFDDEDIGTVPCHEEIVVDDPRDGKRYAYYWKGTGYKLYWGIGVGLVSGFTVWTPCEGEFVKEEYGGSGSFSRTLNTTAAQDLDYIQHLDKLVGTKGPYVPGAFGAPGMTCRGVAEAQWKDAKKRYPKAKTSE
jgi:hypothetical protein